MGTKYPKDLATKKSTQTLSVEPWFFVARSDQGAAPLKIIGDTSRFRVTIINEEKEARTARWTVCEMRNLKKVIADVRTFANHYKWNHAISSSVSGSSPAYTERFLMGSGLKGKTPAEVYAENPGDFKEKMQRQRSYIEGNLGKNGGKYDSGNRAQIAAIDDALALLEENKLQAGSSVSGSVKPIEIWESAAKPLVDYEEDGSFKPGVYPVYKTMVTVTITNDYPVEVKITSLDAPVTRKPDGRLTVKLSEKENEHTNTMNFTFSDFEDVLQDMEDYVQEFKALHAKECFEDSDRCCEENKKASDDKKKKQNTKKQSDSNPAPAKNSKNSLHVISCSPLEETSNGFYHFSAVKDSGEVINIRIGNDTVSEMKPDVFAKFKKKTESDEGASFTFTGSKHRDGTSVYYLFKGFAAV